jgi:hypothetical protein
MFKPDASRSVAANLTYSNFDTDIICCTAMIDGKVTHGDIMSRLPTDNLLPVGVKRRPSTSRSLPFRGLPVCHGLTFSRGALTVVRGKVDTEETQILSAGTGQLLAHCSAHAQLLRRCSDSLLGEHVLIRTLYMLLQYMCQIHCIVKLGCLHRVASTRSGSVVSV